MNNSQWSTQNLTSQTIRSVCTGSQVLKCTEKRKTLFQGYLKKDEFQRTPAKLFHKNKQILNKIIIRAKSSKSNQLQWKFNATDQTFPLCYIKRALPSTGGRHNKTHLGFLVRRIKTKPNRYVLFVFIRCFCLSQALYLCYKLVAVEFSHLRNILPR